MGTNEIGRIFDQIQSSNPLIEGPMNLVVEG